MNITTLLSLSRVRTQRSQLLGDRDVVREVLRRNLQQLPSLCLLSERLLRDAGAIVDLAHLLRGREVEHGLFGVAGLLQIHARGLAQQADGAHAPELRLLILLQIQISLDEVGDERDAQVEAHDLAMLVLVRAVGEARLEEGVGPDGAAAADAHNMDLLEAREVQLDGAARVALAQRLVAGLLQRHRLLQALLRRVVRLGLRRPQRPLQAAVVRALDPQLAQALDAPERLEAAALQRLGDGGVVVGLREGVAYRQRQPQVAVEVAGVVEVAVEPHLAEERQVVEQHEEGAVVAVAPRDLRRVDLHAQVVVLEALRNITRAQYRYAACYGYVLFCFSPWCYNSNEDVQLPEHFAGFGIDEAAGIEKREIIFVASVALA